MSEPARTSADLDFVPQSVRDEFQASLDAYIADWKEQIGKRAETFEAKQGDKAKPAAET